MPETATSDQDAYLQRAFRHFAEICEGQSPLYAVLSGQVAADRAVRSLAAGSQPRQPAVNLLFGAVQDLLLSGVEHPLAEFYPSLGGDREAGEAWPVFTDFCRRFADEITRLVRTRRVQTNDIGRCGVLLPAFFEASAALDDRPLAMIEVGCSAALMLQFNRYRYEYDTRDGIHACGPDSPAVVRTELRDAGADVLPRDVPDVATRVGIDIAPVDVRDDEAIRWLEALLWPEQSRRLQLFRAAVSIARQDPPRLVEGNGLDHVPTEVERASADAVPCIYHSHATCQMSRQWRQDFSDRVTTLGIDRDLAYVSLEWLDDDPGPMLDLTVCRRGVATTTRLAACHHHGAWLQWAGRKSDGGIQ